MQAGKSARLTRSTDRTDTEARNEANALSGQIRAALSPTDGAPAAPPKVRTQSLSPPPPEAPMKAEALTALADRVEREEPSRYLDADIEEAERGYATAEPLYYTTSIDAAVMLVPEGAEWDLTTLYGVARVAVGLNMDEGPHYASHEGGRLPMAICAAALRARAALSPTDGANPAPPKVRTPQTPENNNG